jgi:hypothetical protein
MKYTHRKPAIILLADGTIFHGKAVGGKSGSAYGEICFNTGMTGYQEIFTDPSYFGQLMVTTNAHIGNYGTHPEEIESQGIKIAGLVCKNFSYHYSRPDADMSLEYPIVSRIEGVGPMQYGTKGLLGKTFADIEEKYDLSEAKEGFGEEGEDAGEERHGGENGE